jgi:hypothetical protein
MKQVLVLVALVLGGCSAFKSTTEPVPVRSQVKPEPDVLKDGSGAPIERVPFRAGVSSATVERLARQNTCSGGAGAGLVTEPGPVEVYRMQCENGKVFMARCELRQCKQM